MGCMAGGGAPRENGYAEAFHGRLRKDDSVLDELSADESGIRVESAAVLLGGDWDMVLELWCRDSKVLGDLATHHLSRLPGIAATQTVDIYWSDRSPIVRG